MKKLSKLTTLIVFLGIIFTVPVLTLLKTKEDISQFENRELAKLPEIDKERVLSGEYFKDWETYMADHIYGRNGWLEKYTYMNMNVLEKRKINDIVLGERDTTLPYNPYIPEKALSQNLEDIAEMSERLEKLKNSLESYGGELYFAGIPVQQSFYRERYPEYFERNEEFLDKSGERMFSLLEEKEISSIDMGKVFVEEDRNDYYFKTDHHYNFEGSYRTYREIISRISADSQAGIRGPLEREELDIETVPKEFRGSRNRQIYYMRPTDEKLQIGRPREEVAYRKFTNGNPDPEMYKVGEQDKYVTYDIYMGGDMAEIEVYTDRSELPSLLVVGDSFTNAVEPLLYYHFNETRVLDYRYYSEMDIYEYVEKHRPDFVVYVRDNANYGNLDGNGNFGLEN